jgi:PAS domain S-box-containing protein
MNRQSTISEITLAIDVFCKSIAFADPNDLGPIITEQIRELSGAQTVILLLYSDTFDSYRLLSVQPQRRFNFLSKNEVMQLLSLKYQFTSNINEIDDFLIRKLCENKNIASLFKTTLSIDAQLNAAILLLNLPEHNRLSDLKETLDYLSAMITIAIKNALSKEKVELLAKQLESKVFQQTADLKRINNELLSEKERLSITLESIGDGVITTDINKKIQIINKSAEKILGISAADAYNQSLSGIFKIFENKQSVDPIQLVIDLKKTILNHENSIFYLKDSIERNVRYTASPIIDPDGNISGIVIVFNDITDQVKMLDLAQKADKLEALGLLAGGIAHDFNNLLGGIYGYLDVAIEEAGENSLGKYLGKAVSTIDRARNLTQQLLTFSKGGAPVRQVGKLKGFLIDTTLFALSGSNVATIFTIPEDLWTCNFDKNQISQVLDNLVINAKQAMPDGGNIYVTAENTTVNQNDPIILPEGKYVKISITDTGIGMTDDVMKHIFSPFFTTKPKGHGLGLASCYSIISKHGGCIDVKSEHGKGSTFCIYLPAAFEENVEKIKTVSLQHRGIGSVVVVDDEEVIRETVGTLLEQLGYSTYLLSNCQEAIALMTQDNKLKNKIVALIFDLTIPGDIGGKNAIVEVRKINKDIPVIAVSGYADDPVMSDPLKYGFSASIAKPFRKDDFIRTLNDVIKNG